MNFLIDQGHWKLPVTASVPQPNCFHTCSGAQSVIPGSNILEVRVPSHARWRKSITDSMQSTPSTWLSTMQHLISISAVIYRDMLTALWIFRRIVSDGTATTLPWSPPCSWMALRNLQFLRTWENKINTVHAHFDMLVVIATIKMYQSETTGRCMQNIMSHGKPVHLGPISDWCDTSWEAIVLPNAAELWSAFSAKTIVNLRSGLAFQTLHHQRSTITVLRRSPQYVSTATVCLSAFPICSPAIRLCELFFNLLKPKAWWGWMKPKHNRTVHKRR